MLQKLLVPLDGSELGELALAYAQELAMALNSEINLLSVCERPDSESFHVHELYLEKVAEGCRAQLEKARPMPLVKTAVVQGEPAHTIIDYAQNQDIGMVIMVSHGRSGIMPWATGGTANKVMQRAPVPVLLVRAAATAIKQPPGVFSKILMPVDGSPTGEAALPYIKEIAGKLTCEVILLRVVELVAHTRSIGGLDHIVFSDSLLSSMEKEATEYLEQTAKGFTNIPGRVRTILKTGDAAQEIIRVADEEAVRVVAMSSHGHSGMTRWVLGSVSNKILQAGKTPLLLVRPPAKN